ncbi:MAG: response regulator [Parvularculaceae bacterium]|nr:response regulator [Parvularculaceae bacterium]
MIPVMVAFTSLAGYVIGGIVTFGIVGTYTYLWLTFHQDSPITVVGDSYIDWTVAYLALSSMAVFLYLGTCLFRGQMMGAIRDLQAAKQQSETSERMKSAFLANMSHEIRTPINGIRGMLEVGLQSDDLSKERDKLIIARDAADSLMRLLDDILDHERLESGTVELRREPCDVRGLLFQTVALFSHSTQAKRLDIRTDGLETLPEALMIDATRYGQIVKNLVSNAIKYTDEGSVAISTGYSDANLILSVEDTGIGMPPEFIPRLFDRFSQVEQSLAENAGGAGLGLAICHQLCQAMGGNITADTKVGTGSKFTVTIPAATASLPHGETAMATLPKESRSLSILVAEDNRVNRQVVEAYLRKLGHRCTEAVNGQEALDMMEAASFDLVLMDVAMPVMDGIEATRRIRELGGTKADVPILVLTAHVEASYLQACREAGCTHILHKPLTLTALQRAIDDALADESEGRLAEAV